MKMPEPVAFLRNDGNHVVLADDLKNYPKPDRFNSPLYDKQALIDLLEEAAKECESRQTPNTGSVAILNGAADAIRAMKETL